MLVKSAPALLSEVAPTLTPRNNIDLLPVTSALRLARGAPNGDEELVRHVDRQNVGGACEGAGMTTFVIDAPVAIDLARGGVTIPAQHSLTAPTLLRSQVLALVYGAARRDR